ncbi:MAG: tail fiber domain-containing protein [Ferruginibacter sp.]
MEIKKYSLFVIAAAGIQLSFSQGPAIKVVSTNNTPALAMYGTGGAYKGYLWNKGADDIELGTAGTTGNLHISVNGNQKISVFNNGQVAINGGAYTGTALTINGDMTIRSETAPPEAWTFSANATHALLISENSIVRTFLDDDGDWYAQSDIRLKQNISQYKTVMDGIKKLNISTYEYKSNAGQRSFGLIAQNVLESFPEIVSESTDKEGKKFWGIAYSKTGVLALKGLQEQQRIIESLQQKIERLEKLVTELVNK